MKPIWTIQQTDRKTLSVGVKEFVQLEGTHIDFTVELSTQDRPLSEVQREAIKKVISLLEASIGG